MKPRARERALLYAGAHGETHALRAGVQRNDQTKDILSRIHKSYTMAQNFFYEYQLQAKPLQGKRIKSCYSTAIHDVKPSPNGTKPAVTGKLIMLYTGYKVAETDAT
jgi:hypothetical protein